MNSKLSVNDIQDDKVRETINKVLETIEGRKGLRRNNSRYANYDPEVLLELDVLKLHIIKKFTN